MKNFLGSILLGALILGLTACISSQSMDDAKAGGIADRQTIYVIRHLQKADGENPPLNSEGAAAAIRLATMLEDKRIRAIYATPALRAEETGAPLARRLGIAMTSYDPRDPQALVDAAGAVDGAVLVVGHSNTVPELVERFGGRPVPQLTEDDYGTIFAIDAAGAVRSIKVD